MDRRSRKYRCLAVLAVVSTALAGCKHNYPLGARIQNEPLPRELEKVMLPDYRVEPPDILLIEAVRAVPKPPYKVEPLDVLFVEVTPPIPVDPISGLVTVEPDGTINLSGPYGQIPVQGMTIPEVKAALLKHLKTHLPKDPTITVTISQTRAPQRISGPHLIRPDGSISLGTYGSIKVMGMTLPEVRRAVEVKLSEFLIDPEVSVDVQNYNSKIYYVILDGGGQGQTVQRLPITGNETVLDAIAQVSGLTSVSSQDRIWVSRPTAAGSCHQILPVDWRKVSELGCTTTNYQLMPGDRVYVAAYHMTNVDTALARIISPIERLLGVTLLGTSTYNTVRFPQNSGNNR